MTEDGVVTLYNNTLVATEPGSKSPFSIKVGLAQILRGGAIVEVSGPEQAKIVESGGACCLSVAEPSRGGIGRMADPALTKEIKRVVSLPVVGKARVGHFVEAQVLEALGVDYVDESELLSAANGEHFINKHNFRVPFVCGCRDLGEALRRIREGASMIRTQGDRASVGDVVGTVGGVRGIMGDIRALTNMDDDEVFAFAKRIGVPYDLVAQTKQMGRLPVVHFAAGGIVTPADAALMMQLGCDGVFVGARVFDCADPRKRVRALVDAVKNYNDPHLLAQVSSGWTQGVAA